MKRGHIFTAPLKPARRLRIARARRVALRRIFLVSFAAVFALTVFSPAGRGAAPARFTRLSVEQGLSQSTVQAIIQDHMGFVWLGTEEGLNRYDGYAFVTFRHDYRDPESLADNMVSTLHEDRQNRLWVGTSGGLNLYDRRTESFSRVPGINARVTTIMEDKDGTLWIGTEGAGFYRRDAKSGTLTQFQPEPGDSRTLGSYVVSSLLRDRSGRLWIGTRDAGVDLFQDEGKLFVHYKHDPQNKNSLTHDEVWGLAEDTDGKLWIATYGGGANVLEASSGKFRHYRQNGSEGIKTDLLTCVLADRSGKLWLGTDAGGVQQYDRATDRFNTIANNPGDPASLSQNVVRSIYEDTQGQIWIGTYLGGVNLLKKSRKGFNYVTYNATDREGLVDRVVDSFLEDSDGNIWIGTGQGWLNRFDRETGSFLRYRLNPAMPGGSAILSLHQDRTGRIWVGGYRTGLNLFDPKQGTFIGYRHRAGDPTTLADDEVWAIEEDDAGTLWLATNDGLNRFDPEKRVVLEHYPANYDVPNPARKELSNAGARSLLFDSKGNLWVGTLGGLHVLRKGSDGFVRYLHDPSNPQGLSHSSVVSLHEDKKGNVWIGTYGGGLDRMNADLQTFVSYRDLPSNVVYGIQSESNGRLWVSTNHGLCRVDPETGIVERFDQTNGLQSIQFNLGASLQTRAGRILFGSEDGFYDFDPQSITPDVFAPPVVLTSMRIFNQPANLPAALATLPEVVLTSDDKIFSLEFAALDYTFPRRNRYAYVLEGFSDKLIQLGGKREVTFTNLDPGNYVFRVKASNSDGIWSESSIASIRIVVQPPFWRTWWFRSLVALTLLALLLTAHRLRVRRLTSDLEERKRAEHALRQAEEKYRIVTLATRDAVYDWDLGTSVVWRNEAYQALFSPDEPMGTDETWWEKQIHPDDRERVTQSIRTAFETKSRYWSDEYSFRRANGVYARVDDQGYILYNAHGQPTRMIGAITDITERKRAEEETKSSLREKEVLLKEIHHRVKNNLQIISSLLKLQTEYVKDPSAIGALRESQNRVRSMALIHEKLYSSKNLAGVDFCEYVKSLTAHLFRSYGVNTHDIKLRTNVGSVVLDIERAIPCGLIINELVSNSLKHAFPTGAHGEVKIDLTSDDEHRVVLVVSDDGIGFPPTVKFRETETLGLQLINSLTAQLGGNVELSNGSGRGTTFKITFTESEYIKRI